MSALFGALCLSLLCAGLGASALYAQAFELNVTSPSAGGCVTGDYTVASPFQGGAINGNNQPSGSPAVTFELINPPAESMSFTLSVGVSEPAFEQPPAATCPDWSFGEDQVAACGGQGYCIFTKNCICTDNTDCNGGAGVCRPDQTCGCALDEQCGPGQTCNSDGTCSCATDAACAAGQTCLADGVCSCAADSDCGEGLVCSDGVCGVVVPQGVSFLDAPNPQHGDSLSIFMPAEVVDASQLNLTLEARVPSSFDPVASVSRAFSLDRDFPLIVTNDSCSSSTPTTPCPEGTICQGTCPAGLVCDPVRSRCDTLANVELGACRPEDDFSQGLPAAYQLTDEFDATPTFSFVSSEVNGCLTEQRFVVSDSCGNAQLVTLNSQRAPLPNEVSAAVVGHRCFDERCDIQTLVCDPTNPELCDLVFNDPDLSSGQSAGRARLRPVVSAPAGCFDYAEMTLQSLDAGGGVVSEAPFLPSTVLQALPASVMSTRAISNGQGGVVIVNSGTYTLADGQTLELNVSGQVELITMNSDDFFDITQALAIDVIQVINAQSSLVTAYLDDNAFMISTREKGEGVTLDVSGSAAEPLGFTAAFNSDSGLGSGDGAFRAQLNVYACGADVAVVNDQFDVTITPVQPLTLGGPYQVDQGEALTVSASGSVAPEFGGFTYIEWDTDGDGLYEATTRVDFDPPLSTLAGTLEEGSAVELDTTEDGVFLVKARLGLVTGDPREAQTNVEVLDVSPTCVEPALFVAQSPAPSIPVSEEAIFDASNSLGGHESDPVIAYEWTFGDGGTSSVQTPTVAHTYAQEGEYTVTLNVRDVDSSCVSPVSFTVRVTGAEPILENVGLEQPNAPRVEGQPITFSAGDTRAGSASDPLTDYTWSFGYVLNGVEVTASGPQLETPTHTYADDGLYQVCLIVSDTSGDVSAPSCFDVEVADLSPVVALTGPPQATEGDEVTFDATGTIAGGAADQLSALRWDFGDGSAPVTTDPTQLTVSHTFNSDSVSQNGGSFTVTLTALDEDSEVSVTRTIQVLDVRPNARFSVLYPSPEVVSAEEGVALTLDASASSAGAPSDPIARYTWDFGDGSDPVVTQSPTVSHAWPDGPRDYLVSLTVEDSDGSLAVAEQSVSVLNLPPVVSISASDLEPQVGSPVTFTLNVEDVLGDQPESSDNPVVIEWDFGDDSAYTTPTVEHTFSSEGPTVIRVRYVDGDAGEAEAELALNVAPRPATIEPPVVQVHTELGALVANPRAPLGEFSDVPASDSAFFMREGESLTVSVRVSAAQLSNGSYDTVNAVWGVTPNGAETSYEVTGPDALTASLTWTPSFFQAGQYLLRLTAEGEVTGSSVTREWRVYVAEAGTPMLAATTGNQRRGRVLLYSYGRENARLSFTPTREVEVGMGAVDVLFDEQRARLFVTSPGSSHVAVLGGDPVSVLRYIPTGPAPYALAMGGGYVWVTEANGGALSAISPHSLKLTQRLSLPDAVHPQSAVWVGEEQGLATGRVIVGDAKTGELYIINATQMISGRGVDAIEARLPLAASVTHLLVAEGRLYVADGKRRVLYSADLTALMINPNVSAFELIDSIPFATQDLTFSAGSLWVAAGASLWRVDPVTGEAEALERAASRLTPVDPLSVGGEGLILSDGARLENVTVEEGELTPVIGVDSPYLQQMTPFLSRTSVE